MISRSARGLVVAAVLASLLQSPVVAADSSAAPPALNTSAGATKLSYIEGEIHFANRTTSVQYIADLSWQLCGMRGLQGSEDYEIAYTYRTTGGWYVYYRHWENNLAIWWYCIK